MRCVLRPSAQRAIGRAPVRPLRVLVADADVQRLSLYRELLLRAGCEVIQATDGRDALTKALVRRPSIVIVDALLPFIDGAALCDILRRDSVTRDAPILVLTADAHADHIDRLRAAGADAVLVDPPVPQQLLEEVDRLTSRAQPGGQIPAAPGRSLAGPPDTRRRNLAKAYLRYATTTPPVTPPSLLCPSCDRSLVYQHSHVGGVSYRYAEQWDEYVCPVCGSFEYRQRTRKLQRVV
jgi:CheY-like chemotaxis protein